MSFDRSSLEAEILRAQRRGELAEAIRLLEELAARYPDDSSLPERLAALRESLQPSELVNVGASAQGGLTGALDATSPEIEGERLFALGDYAGAASAYRRALAQRPDSELLQERLGEIFELAKRSPAQSPTDKPLPASRERLLEALMDRIASRRRA